MGDDRRSSSRSNESSGPTTLVIDLGSISNYNCRWYKPSAGSPGMQEDAACASEKDVPWNTIFACICGKRVKAPGARPGRVGSCPACGSLLEVPAIRPSSAPDPLAAMEKRMTRSPLRTQRARIFHYHGAIPWNPRRALELVDPAVKQSPPCRLWCHVRPQLRAWFWFCQTGRRESRGDG